MELLSFALLGIGAGSVYALSAQSLILVYRGSGVVNFAQGGIGMVGAVTYYRLNGANDVPAPIALPAAIGASAALGAAMHLLLLSRLRHASALTRLVAPLAALAVLLSAAQWRYGYIGLPVQRLVPSRPVELTDELRVGSDRLVLFAIGIAITVVLSLVYSRTRFGLATSAVSENESSAAGLGISPNVVAAANWAIAGALSGAAAIFITSIGGVLDIQGLSLLLVPALAAMFAASFRSFWIAWAVGMGIGVFESEMARYVSTPGIAKAVPFLVVVLLMGLRGQGIPLRGEHRETPPRLGSGELRPGALTITVAAVLAWIWVAPTKWTDATTTTLVTAIVVLSITVVTGMTGQVSIAQYAIAGLSALVAARLVDDWGWPFELAIPVGVLAAIPAGVIVGLPSLRTRGINLAIATFGLAVVIDAMAFSNSTVTHGQSGIPIGQPSLFGIEVDAITRPERYATLVLILVVACLLVVLNLRRSLTGLRLIAVRDDERAAAAHGVDVVRTKVSSFALASAIAGLGGIMLAFRNGRVLFTPFAILQSVYAVLNAVIGGIGSAVGALIGGVMAAGGIGTRLTEELLGEAAASRAYGFIAAAIAVLVLLQAPSGLVMMYRDVWAKVRRPQRRPIQLDAVDDRFRFEPVVPARLALDDVSVSFGGVTALSGVSLTVTPGQVLGLIGPNGAGKTTLIDAATGFVGATGSVSLDGRSIGTGSPSRRARRGVARSFQSLGLFESLTVGENLAVAADRSGWAQRVRDLVWPRRARLSPFAVKLLEHLQLVGLVDTYPSELSYGQRRLVAIARAAVSRPSVLFLDEPAAGLSTHEATELGHTIRWLAEELGMAVVVVEHNLDLVLSISDAVAVLVGGRLAALDRPSEVLANAAVVEAYVGHAEATALTAGNAREQRHADVVLRATGIEAGYAGVPVVRVDELTVHRGEVVALLGPNGAGKSTLLRSLSGHVPLIAGEVEGERWATYVQPHRRARAGLAYVPEERAIFFRLTVMENLRLGRGDIDAALALFPELRPLLDRRCALLSGGEQQMVSLARALAAKPTVLLVDELSLGLAPIVADRLCEAIRRAALDGVAVVLVEQQVRRALAVADRAVVLRQGAVVLSAPASEIDAGDAALGRLYLTGEAAVAIGDSEFGHTSEEMIREAR